jgi:hypothetical protein
MYIDDSPETIPFTIQRIAQWHDDKVEPRAALERLGYRHYAYPQI